MNKLSVSNLTPDAFAPFGVIGMPTGDGGHAAGDVPLDLSQGRPRFYIMRLQQRGLAFDRMARHRRVTQCLGATDGRPWLIAVAPPGIESPSLDDICAFESPGIGSLCWRTAPGMPALISPRTVVISTISS